MVKLLGMAAGVLVAGAGVVDRPFLIAIAVSSSEDLRAAAAVAAAAAEVFVGVEKESLSSFRLDFWLLGVVVIYFYNCGTESDSERAARQKICEKISLKCMQAFKRPECIPFKPPQRNYPQRRQTALKNGGPKNSSKKYQLVQKIMDELGVCTRTVARTVGISDRAGQVARKTGQRSGRAR